jgi:hypothetical protein
VLKWFIHDGNKLLVDDCLNQGLLSNIYPLPYLMLCANEREWTGIPSTTQLIKGSREAFLLLTTPYYINPDRQAFRTHGTMAHLKLEKQAPFGSYAEIPMVDDDISMIFDLLFKQPNGDYWLIDYKTTGSYKISKALGIEKHKRPMVDDMGLPVVYKRGNKSKGFKKGDPRQETYFTINPNKADLKDWELQLNRYKIVAEKHLSVKIAKIKIFCIARDGNTKIAKSYGLETMTHYIDVRKLPVDRVVDYFKYKRDVLIGCLAEYKKLTGITPKRRCFEYDMESIIETCPDRCEDTWGGRKCESWCDVSEMCNKIDLC